MTLSTAQRMFAVTGFVLLGCAAIFFYYFLANQSQKAELNAKLTGLQATVATINAARQAPEASDPLLHTPAFPRNPPDLALASAVLASATSSGVSAGPIQTTTGGDAKIGNDTYRATVLNLTISGTLPQILGFFDRMEHAGIRTVVFDNIRLEPGSGKWIAQLQVIAYAQPQ